MKRVCLLTGAGGRLGSAFCQTCAADYNISAVYRRSVPQCATQHRSYVDPLNPHAEHETSQNSVFAIQADLEDDKEIRRVTELTLARFGVIDLVVNCAAHIVTGSLISSAQVMDESERQFRVNTLVPLRLSVHVATEVWRCRGSENSRLNRNVVNVSSTSGFFFYEGSGQTVYAASKAAMNHMTRYMAEEFAIFKVRVNAIAPNSFPSVVPTEAVVEGIRRLDQSSETGRILVLDHGRDELV